MGFFEPIRLWLSGRERRKPSSAAQDEQNFRQIAENSSDMICRIGADGVAKYFSPASEILFGWTPAEMVAMDPGEFFYPEDMPILHRSTARLVSGASMSGICQLRARRKDGSTAWVETRTRLAPDPEGRGPGDLIVVLRDITERKQLEDQLARLALTDALTGVANRRAFDESLDSGWRATLAKGSHMSLLLLDIDHFKRFNDGFGHQVGDDCLRTVALTIRAAISGADMMVARFGGEEFAAVLPDADLAEAGRLGEAVRNAVLDLALPHPTNDGAPFVTVSVGAATAMSCTGGTMNMPASLLQAADMALYKAKHNGRNRVETSLLLTAGDG